jgi:hypothetical protein
MARRGATDGTAEAHGRVAARQVGPDRRPEVPTSQRTIPLREEVVSELVRCRELPQLWADRLGEGFVNELWIFPDPESVIRLVARCWSRSTTNSSPPPAATWPKPPLPHSSTTRRTVYRPSPRSLAADNETHGPTPHRGTPSVPGPPPCGAARDRGPATASEGGKPGPAPPPAGMPSASARFRMRSARDPPAGPLVKAVLATLARS